jgi:inward rectifier potassium channel
MRLAFSDSAIIAPYEGGRGLMFRIVNLQPGELSDVQARVNLAWFEEINGVRERNFHELALERNSVEFFTLHWTIVHPITPASPLAGITPEALAASQAEFLIVVSALEETFSTRVSARSSYVWDEIRWDVKFASIFANGPEGVIAIDVERLSRTEPLDEGATRTPAELELSGTGASALLGSGADRLEIQLLLQYAKDVIEMASSFRNRTSIRRSALIIVKRKRRRPS